MASKLVGKAGQHLFSKHIEQYAPQDPMYEEYVDAKGKTKRRRRGIPLGLSKRDQKILKSVQRRAHYLDKGFHICGIRFGWTFIIGIIPGAGDVLDIILNYTLVVRKARQAEIPAWLLRKMLMNNAVSATVGFVPLVGDIMLAAYKANSRNAALFEEFLRIRGEELLKLEQAGNDAAGAADPVVASSSKVITSGAVKSDAEKIKPGAGAESGEIIEGTKKKSFFKK